MLLDVEDGSAELRNKAIALSVDIATLEEDVGAEALMRGREVHQIERFNAGRAGAAGRLDRDGLFARGANVVATGGSFGPPTAAASPGPVSPRQPHAVGHHRRSFQSSLEEFVMAKIAL